MRSGWLTSGPRAQQLENDFCDYVNVTLTLFFHHAGVLELAPLVNSKKKERLINNCYDLTEEVLDPTSFLVKYLDFDSTKFTEVRLNKRKRTRPSKK